MPVGGCVAWLYALHGGVFARALRRSVTMLHGRVAFGVCCTDVCCVGRVLRVCGMAYTPVACGVAWVFCMSFAWGVARVVPHVCVVRCLVFFFVAMVFCIAVCMGVCCLGGCCTVRVMHGS